MWGPLLCLGAPMLHDGPRRSYPQHGLLLAESVSNRNMFIHYSVMIIKKNAIKTKKLDCIWRNSNTVNDT